MSAFNSFSLSEKNVKCRFMIDTLNIINVSSFFKPTSGTSG